MWYFILFCMCSMARRRFSSTIEMQTLLEASDSDEVVSEFENHTSSVSEGESSDEDTNIFGQSVADAQSILSKNRQIEWTLDLPQRYGRLSSANIIRSTPGVTSYACSRIKDVKSLFEILSYEAIEKQVIKMTNIEGQQIYKENWKNLDRVTF